MFFAMYSTNLYVSVLFRKFDHERVGEYLVNVNLKSARDLGSHSGNCGHTVFCESVTCCLSLRAEERQAYGRKVQSVKCVGSLEEH